MNDAQGQLRIVTYNTNNFSGGETLPRAGMATVLEALGDQAKAGFARPVDILLLEEQSTLATTTAAYVDLLNGIYGAGTYARGLLQGSTTGGGRPAVVYNTHTVQLVAESQASTASSTGGPRATLRYQFRPLGYDSAADFYVYASHFKAVNDADSAQRRGVEAAEIRADADALGEGTLAIYAGDLNFYRSSEIGFQTLVAPGAGQAFDPVDQVGSWTNSSAYRDVHTQSPVTSAVFPGQVTGGLDDRFDFQLVTGEVLDGRGFDYISGSYWALGNTGTHSLNGALSTGSVSALQAWLPGYTSQDSAAVIDALMAASDHLPVVADYQLPAKLAVVAPSLPTRVLRDAVVSGSLAVSNAAPVAVAAGADTLSYAIIGSGAVTASGSGSRSPLSAPAPHSLGFDTSLAGLRTGTLTVTTSSPQAASPTFTESYSIQVLDRASLSAGGGGTGGGGTGGGGTGGGGTGGGGTGDGVATPFAGVYSFNAEGNVAAFAYNGESLAGVTVGDLLKVGVTSSSSMGNFRGTTWPAGGTNGSDLFAGDFDPGKYIEFTLTAEAEGMLDMDAVEFGLGRSSTGPRQWQWRSSADGFAVPLSSFGIVSSGLNQSDGVLTNPDSNSSWVGNVLDLSGDMFQGLSAVTLRLYGFNAEGSGGTGGLQGPLTFRGTFVAAGSIEPPPIEPPPIEPPPESIGAGDTITIANAAPEPGTQRAAAAITSRSLSGAAGWSVSGLTVGETVAAGGAVTGLAEFDPTGRLNGPYAASLTLGFEHADQTLPGAAVADLGTLSWNLATTVAGQTGSGTTVVTAGASLAGLGIDSAGTHGTIAVLEAGVASTTQSVTMAFSSPPTEGLFASDVLTLTGTSGDAVVLSLSYDTAAAGILVPEDLCLGWLDTRLQSPTYDTWINAVEGNAAQTVSLMEPFVGSWLAYTQEFIVAAPAAAVGAWGIDRATSTAWAVIDHNSQFAVVPWASDPVADIVIDVPSGTVTQAQAGYAQILVADSVTKTGAGLLVFDAANSYAGPTTVSSGMLQVVNPDGLPRTAVTVESTGTLALPQDSRLTVQLAALDVADGPGGGRLDLGVGEVSIAPGGITAEALRTDILTGRNGGGWNGTTGIMSSAVASAGGTRAVGYLVASDGSARVTYAAPGDTNLNGQVDVFDLVSVNSAGTYGTGATAVWAEGDFNYDGVTNVFDLVAVNAAGAYGQGKYLPTLTAAGDLGQATAVPEPTLMGLLAVGAAAGIVRCRRRP